MATVYTAIIRANELARRNNDSYTVWRDRVLTNKNCFIVKNAAEAAPPDFVRFYTVGPNGYDADKSGLEND